MPNTLKLSGPVIHTPDQRLRVFISSTIGELANERLAAKKAISNLHLIPVLFELGARPYPPRDLYSSYLVQSQIFIGIYGERYGQLIPELDISGLEDEFQLSARHPRLIYIKRPAPQRDPRLQLLIDQIMNAGLSCKFFSESEELCGFIENDLALLLTERFQSSGNAAPPQEWKNLVPVPATPLIGRDAEVASVKNLLLQNDIRLVTLTGTGGIGKTRLALELAHQLMDQFNDGVFFVSLASVNDAALVPASIVQAIFPGELAAQPPLELLTKLFYGKDVLLVLDNFEQAIGAAPFVSDLLRFCEGLKILVTSREALRISGEHDFPVPVLSLPDAVGMNKLSDSARSEIEQSQSVQLFVQRAKSIDPSFELTNENAGAVAEICISLDGLPLAIELAAARIRVLSPQAMLPRLEKRLSLLTSGFRDLPDRHRKLSATIDWSYLMLTAEEQQLLCKLAVFSGGCCIPSAYIVTGNSDVKQLAFPRMAMYLNDPAANTETFEEPTIEFLGWMESLTAKNLIYRQERTDEVRFMMYHTIKEYAMDQLASIEKKEQCQKNHFHYYLRLAESLWESLRGDDAVHSYELLDREIDNLREALAWGWQHDPLSGLRLALALGEYWDTRGMPDEQIYWTERLLKKATAEQLPEASLMAGLAKIEIARATFREGRHEDCSKLAEEVTRLSKQLDNPLLFVDSIMVGGMVAAYKGTLSEIKAMIEEALEISRKKHYQMGTINLLQNLAASANAEGRFADAVALTDESLVLAIPLGATRWEAISYGIRGFAQMNLGAIDDSAASFSKSLECSKRFMDSVIVVYPLIGLGQVAAARGQIEKTIKLMGAVEKLCERKGTAIVPMVRHIVSLIQDAVRSQVGPEAYQQLFEAGCRLQLNEAIALAEA